jgi:hypothetical protein
MPYKAGEFVEDKGIYMGSAPIFKNLGLTQYFAVFAHESDYMSMGGPKRAAFEFDAAVTCVAQQNESSGLDALPLEDEEALVAAIKSGTYQGQWVLPSYTIMNKIIASQKDQGSFKGSFQKSAVNSFEGPEHYWVLSDGADMPESANRFCIDNNRFLTCLKDDKIEGSVRPVRLEPIDLSL